MEKPEAKHGQDKKIEDLKRRAEELCGGEMNVRGLDDCPVEAEEAFWNAIVDYEKTPSTTHFHQLESAGVSLPLPGCLNDQELTEKLWEVIHALALLRVFMEQTDHLSDRELYTQLWTDCLSDDVKDLPPTANSGWHIPMLGACSEEDSQLYLKYYADDVTRQHWQGDFPEDCLPLHEDLPYDRDRSLPKRDYHSMESQLPN